MPRPQIIDLPNSCPCCNAPMLVNAREHDADGVVARSVAFMCGASIRRSHRDGDDPLEVAGCPAQLFNLVAIAEGLPAWQHREWVDPDFAEVEEPHR